MINAKIDTIHRLLASVLNNPNKSILFHQKETDVSYSHIVKLIREMETQKIIITEFIGRTRHVNLTVLGEEYTTLFLMVFSK